MVSNELLQKRSGAACDHRFAILLRFVWRSRAYGIAD